MIVTSINLILYPCLHMQHKGGYADNGYKRLHKWFMLLDYPNLFEQALQEALYQTPKTVFTKGVENLDPEFHPPRLNSDFLRSIFAKYTRP